MLSFVQDTIKQVEQNPPDQLSNRLVAAQSQVSEFMNVTCAAQRTLAGDISRSKAETANRVNEVKAQISEQASAVASQIGTVQTLAVQSVQQVEKKLTDDILTVQETLSRDMASTKSEATRQVATLKSQLVDQNSSMAAQVEVTQNLAVQTTQHVEKKLADDISMTRKDLEKIAKDQMLVTTRVNGLPAQVKSAADKAKQDALNSLTERFVLLNSLIAITQGLVSSLTKKEGQLEAALSENVYLVLDSAAENVSAVLLNAAAAGTFQKTITCSLSALYGEGEDQTETIHEWASFKLVVTATEQVTDTDVAAPEITWLEDVEADPTFVRGVVQIIATFDTDAGATKTYVLNDTVKVDFQVAVDDKWLGHTVTKVTKTYTVVA